MRVALVTTFAASRKEPLLTMMDRVHQGFLDAGLGEPAIRFNFGDAMIGGVSSVSSVDRVLKRHPELARFVTTADPMPGFKGARRISNGPMSAGAGDNIPYSTLQAIAAGVPRSFPFHSIALHFYSPEFGEQVPTQTPSAGMMTGVLVTDSWWVNGRNRSLSACTVVEAETGSKNLPPHPPTVATVLAACGKARKTIQAPLAENVTGPVPAVRLPSGTAIASADPAVALKVHEVVLDYRKRMPEIVSLAAMPHDLPAPEEAIAQMRLEITSGPKKPALERVFKPMGYTCRGEAGDFALRRRTASNLTLELHVGIGSWGKTALAMFRVWGLGFKALLSIPPTAKAIVHGQYPVGDADQWQKIAENLGALVAELERTFVPAIEAAAGPSPEWYRPES